MARVLMLYTECVWGPAFKGVLEVEDFEVISVHTVAEAVYHATHTRFNIVMQDIRINGERSFDLAEALTIYDPLLPLIAYAYTLLFSRSEEATIARIPFKAVFHIPASAEHIVGTVERYARQDIP